MAADGGVQRINADLGLGNRRHQIKRPGRVLLRRLVAGGGHRQYVRQRSDLHRLAVKVGDRQPRVFAVILEVGGTSASSRPCTVQRLVVCRPSTRTTSALTASGDAFGKYLSLKLVIALKVDTSPLAIWPPGIANFVALAVERDIGHRDVVGDAATVGRPVGIEGTDGGDIDR